MPTQPTALSINEFCQSHGISRSMFYNLLKQNKAPRIMKLGRRTLITTDAIAQWRESMEVQN
jgi:predicted DNA-binding transcriptional regulator AlpA